MRNRIVTVVKKMRIKVHPDMLKRKNSGMSEKEKNAIDEHAKKFGGAAEVLLDPDRVFFSSMIETFEVVMTHDIACSVPLRNPQLGR